MNRMKCWKVRRYFVEGNCVYLEFSTKRIMNIWYTSAKKDDSSLLSKYLVGCKEITKDNDLVCIEFESKEKRDLFIKVLKQEFPKVYGR